MVEKIKQETRRYAKRQLTWFRKNKQTIWIKAENGIQNNIDITDKTIFEYLNVLKRLYVYILKSKPQW